MARPQTIPQSLSNSIAYRRRLTESLCSMELDVLCRLDGLGVDALIVGPWLVRRDPGGLTLIEREPVPESQLPLPFDTDELSQRRA